MPPNSKLLKEEGAAIVKFKLVDNGVFQEAGITELLMAPGVRRSHRPAATHTTARHGSEPCRGEATTAVCRGKPGSDPCALVVLSWQALGGSPVRPARGT